MKILPERQDIRTCLFRELFAIIKQRKQQSGYALEQEYNMRKKIMLACLGIILACLFLLVTDGMQRPGHKAKAPDKIRVALSQSEALTPWKTAQLNSFQEAAAGRGI